MKKEELTRVLHSVIKVINDEANIATQDFNLKDYENIFNNDFDIRNIKGNFTSTEIFGLQYALKAIKNLAKELEEEKIEKEKKDFYDGVYGKGVYW